MAQALIGAQRLGDPDAQRRLRSREVLHVVELDVVALVAPLAGGSGTACGRDCRSRSPEGVPSGPQRSTPGSRPAGSQGRGSAPASPRHRPVSRRRPRKRRRQNSQCDEGPGRNRTPSSAAQFGHHCSRCNAPDSTGRCWHYRCMFRRATTRTCSSSYRRRSNCRRHQARDQQHITPGYATGAAPPEWTQTGLALSFGGSVAPRAAVRDPCVAGSRRHALERPIVGPNDHRAKVRPLQMRARSVSEPCAVSYLCRVHRIREASAEDHRFVRFTAAIISWLPMCRSFIARAAVTVVGYCS